MIACVFGACDQTTEDTTQTEESETTVSTTEATTETATETATEEGYVFAFVEAAVHPYYAPFPDAVETAAEDFGIPVPTIQAPSDFVQEDQNTILDAIIAQGVDGLAMQPSDAVAANEKISEIVAMGIPVVGFGGAPAEPTDMTFCLATDVAQSAYEGTIALIDAMGGSGNVVHLAGQLGDVNTVARMEAVEQACDEYPDVTLLQTITDVDETEAAQNAINNLLASSEDEVDGIIATGYNQSVAVATTFTQRQENRIKSIGCDTDDVVLQAIRDGYMTGTMSQNPWGQAYLCTYALKLFADGYTWADDDVFFVNSGFYLLSQDNVDNATELAAAATEELIASFEGYFVAP
ncbi:MAG: sugar ABC transporter substrate-binding protein [Eubacteriales bacterium]|nr:sugar ABC transporter substrate-binding protein [Eubacteriales bacterium]